MESIDKNAIIEIVEMEFSLGGRNVMMAITYREMDAQTVRLMMDTNVLIKSLQHLRVRLVQHIVSIVINHFNVINVLKDITY